jgi:hypothetical protein
MPSCASGIKAGSVSSRHRGRDRFLRSARRTRGPGPSVPRDDAALDAAERQAGVGGDGPAHSEYSTPTTTVLHGAQLWIALPEADRLAVPGFAHYEPPVTDVDGAKVLVFLGSLFGQTSPVPTYSALVGAEVTLPAGHWLDVKVDAGHEHGFLCDTGRLAVGGAVAQPGEIVFRARADARRHRGSGPAARRVRRPRWPAAGSRESRPAGHPVADGGMADRPRRSCGSPPRSETTASASRFATTAPATPIPPAARA